MIFVGGTVRQAKYWREQKRLPNALAINVCQALNAGPILNYVRPLVYLCGTVYMDRAYDDLRDLLERHEARVETLVF